MLPILLVLHIVCFGLAMSLTAGVGMLLGRIAASQDLRLIHKAFAMAAPLPKIGGALWFAAAGLGLATAVVAGLPLGAGWLIASYAAFAVLAAVGLGVHAPWQAKVVRLSAADVAAGETVRPELAAALASPLEKLATVLTLLGIIALIWLMVAKPGG
jgi:uncharacterized membrane protein